ncbi:MAG TPA: EAL domain-containing protein [Trichocoleus sp.]|jgi:diguanylate cyclase (GGDEF)-like protein/PAS domain S-box-containing protein
MYDSVTSVLLVEDDEDDYIITQSLLSEIKDTQFQVEWVNAYETALAIIAQHRHDIYLVDYRLGKENGLDLLREAILKGCYAPMILLTGQGDHEVDVAAIRTGAADYLVKSELNAAILERAIRHAIEHSQTLAKLRQALHEKNQLAQAIANVTVGVVITDPNLPNNPVIFINPAFTTLTGYTSSEILGKNCRCLQGAETDPVAVRQLSEAVRQRKSITRTLINYRKDGTPFWNELILNPVFDVRGNLTHFIGFQTDVTARKLAEEALRESEERYALAVRGANDGIWDWNLRTNEVYFSPRWKTMLGYEEYDLSNSLDEWFERIHSEDLYWVKRQVSAHLDNLTPHFESEYRMLHQDGSYRWMLSRGLAVRNAEGQATRIAGSQTDMTIWKQAEEKLVHDALHDMLTGLPNRILLMERLRHAVQLAQRSPEFLFAVLFIDLDRFKVINDSLGHMVGDQLLIAIARRLAHCLRPSDTVARLGGDEFVILLEDIKDTAAVAIVAERIKHELALPFNLEDNEVYTAASIGIAFSTLNYENPEDLLRDADTAMYRAKAQGRARYEIFHPGMHINALALLQLETDLRRAIERQELRLHYQPIIALRTLQVIGFEALIRWQHPQRGIIYPNEFISLAEETGLIMPMSEWCLREACHQMKAWETKFSQPLTVSVNLSSKQFTPQITVQVQQILKETGLAPQRLKLEITESLLMENAESAIDTLSELRELGIQLAIDDFGTGYSSLSYLHRFPIDTLKIDRSFINKIDVDGEQLAIVRTIITLAWNLGMEVVAEGVETTKQLSQLRSLHCEYAQGYLFAKPLAESSVEQLIYAKPVSWQNYLV